MKECIQGLWIGKSLSLMEQLSIKSFLAHGHEYHLYVYRKVRNVPKGTIIKDANVILPKHRIFKYEHGFGKGSYSGFANLFRLKLLLENGGIWVDLDVVCLRPFNFKKKYVFSSEKTQEGKVKIHNGIIKSPKGCKFIKACYKEAEKRDTRTLLHGQIGSDLLTSNINKFDLQSFIVPPNTFCPIDPWDFKKLIDSNFSFKISKEIYSIHLWNEKWRGEIKKEDAISYRKKTIYKTSAKLKEHSRIYLLFINFVKDNIPKLQLIPFNYSLEEIEGFLHHKEQQLLYAIAKTTKGPILEIGPWLGLSTACIAYGIKDSGMNKEFVTVELNQGVKNFKPVENGKIGFFYPINSKKPLGVCSVEVYEKQKKPILLKPRRAINALKQNLSKLGLLKFVTIKEGDFRVVAPKKKYKFIFCDALHTKAEIDQNAPALKKLLSSESLFVCHDINDEDKKKYLEGYIPIKHSFIINNLYIGFIGRKSIVSCIRNLVSFMERALLEPYKEKKTFVKTKYNKDKIYSSKTLYGQLQRRYL